MNINQILFSIDALILLGVAVIHFYWAFGGKWGANAVLPQINSEKRVFTPSPLMTLAVAVPFLIISVIFAQAAGWMDFEIIAPYLPTLLLVLVAVFAIRALGDFKYVGFFKKVKNTDFAINDTKYFTPLCAFVAVSLLIAIYI
ncbi:DUF3995 domain-containing protein [Lacihabitans soyangensis]|uniref:DUF3995 domain-containing protein n=1 Tax=Lacihabitans soyangensis TaxID=869394 RepID=A0AAE3KXM7_9BACT|nr:DUF3995 domain-containing protein [Lacihabitans soyangensis]MCP9765400.1 DUF3995 domain-containing protein [Lacihabitans soyangensis]